MTISSEPSRRPTFPHPSARITCVMGILRKLGEMRAFPGNWCGVPTVVGHYLIQSVPALHGIVVLDIAHGDKPVEVSRVRLNDTFEPHWTGWDAKTQRIVVTGSEPRLYLLKFDTQV